MVANFTQKLSQQQRLIDQLSKLPAEWALTPVKGNKACYRSNWQFESPLSHQELITEIKSGKAKGYGIRTGTVSGGIVAVDADGHAAHDKINELSGGVLLPETVAFTSNKPGYCQYLFHVPQEYWGAIATKKIGTGVKGDDGKEQKVELRWDGCQSVLPPSVHPETGCYHWRKSPEEIAIAPAPMWVIERMLKESGETETPLLNHQPQPYEHWDDINWALSYLNALSPSRADNYDDWLTVGMALHSLNEDSLLLNWDDWSKMSSKYKVGECGKKWKSFNRQGVAIGSLAHMAKQDGWRSPFKSSGRDYSSGIGFGDGGNPRGGSGGSGGGDRDGSDRTPTPGKVVNFPGFEPAALEEVTEKIDKLISRGVSRSKLRTELNRLAASCQVYVGELRKLYEERLGEVEVEGDRDTNRDEIGSLLNLNDQSLDLADYLPPSLAEPLSQWGGWLALRPAVILTALLTGTSTLHKVGTELVIHRNKHFKVPPTIYSALVSESGQLKSPVFSNIVRSPLNKLRKEKLDEYEAAMADYEAAMQAWEQSENKGEKPKKPAEPTLFYFTNATGESIPVQASKAPDKGLLALIDELAGLFKSENAHRGGRGSDKQDLLSYFDGLGQTVLRASGVKVDVERINLSIFGTIQPGVLKSLMMDCTDPDGQWARFLFVNQPLAFAPLGEDDGQAISISDRIADFYRRLHRLPEMEYRLSRLAFKCYLPFHDQLERLRVTHPKAGMRAVYSKMKGYVGRLALNLHVLWELDAGKDCPDEEIPLFIMEMAIQLAKFYMGQVKLMHANADDESLPTHIVKLIELSKRLEANGKDGWIKAQAYRDQFDSKKRPSAQQAREWMNEAIALGYGRTRGTGNRLEYHWFSDNKGDDNQSTSPVNLGKLREDLGKTLPVVESVENKGIETYLGNLGKGIPNLSITNNDGCDSAQESSEERGYAPGVSLSTPQDTSDADTVGNADLGNNLGKLFPNLPELSLSASPPDTWVSEAVTQQPLTASSNVETAEEEAIAPVIPVENHPETTEPTMVVETRLTTRQDAVEEETPTPAQPEEKYSQANVEADGRGELSRVSYEVTAATDKEAIATPPTPCENHLESTHTAVEALTPPSVPTALIQEGDRCQFINPDELPSLRHLEGIELEVVSIKLFLAECKLPDGSTDSFGLRALQKLE